MSTDRNDIPAVLTDEAIRAPTYRVMLQYGALLKRLIFSNDSAVVHLPALSALTHTCYRCWLLPNISMCIISAKHEELRA